MKRKAKLMEPQVRLEDHGILVIYVHFEFTDPENKGGAALVFYIEVEKDMLALKKLMRSTADKSVTGSCEGKTLDIIFNGRTAIGFVANDEEVII